MTGMRIRLALGAVAVAVVGVLGLAACGSAGNTATGSAVNDSDVSAEAQVLAAMGFDPADVAAAQVDPAPSATPSRGPKGDRGHKRLPGRVWLGKNVLHGEAVVETDNGTKTIDVQRGTVTAINDKTVTVKSSDGFTLTWTFGNPIRVVERRTTVQPSAIAVGTEIGLAGTKEGSTVTARLIVIPRK